jgi:hypothetical protein
MNKKKRNDISMSKRYVFTSIFIAALLTIAKICISKISIERKIEKCLEIYIMSYYSATKK